MIAMQYTIPFDASQEMARVRRRIAEKAPLFDSDVAAAELEHHRATLARPALRSHTVGLDPELWEIVRFSLWRGADDAAPWVGERHDYDVAHLSAPAEAAPLLAAGA